MTQAPAIQRLLLVEFPTPTMARVLSPNGSRVHWAAAKRAKDYVSMIVAGRALACDLERMRGFVTIQPVWTFPERRKRDDDNLGTGVMKVVRDALVRGRWLEADDTDHLRQMPPEVRVVKGVRSLELVFSVEGA